MYSKGIVISIACFLFIGVMTFLIWCTTLFFQNNKKYDEAWQLGYDEASSVLEEYTATINKLNEEKTSLSSELSSAQIEITNLRADNENCALEIENLNSEKTELENTVSNLTQIKNKNEATIANLEAIIEENLSQIETLQADIDSKTTLISNANSRISELESTITQLESAAETNTAEIATLKHEKSELQKQITNLNSIIIIKSQEINTLKSNLDSTTLLLQQTQNINEMQTQTITSLNSRIISLNSQISELTLQIQNNSNNVTTLNKHIAELEKSVAYYEEYISSLETGNQVVLTFEFDNSVYNIQVIAKGSTASITNPTSTQYVIFNGWLINGESVDLSTHVFNTNTIIKADVTYKYDAIFMNGDEIVNNQIVTKGTTPTLPTNPTKTGYEFDGWSRDGVNIVSDVEDTPIIANTTYYAVFTKLHTVTYTYGENSSTEIVRNGALPTSIPAVSDTETQFFDGWLSNGIIVDPAQCYITSDTNFVAKYITGLNVTYMSDDEVLDTILVRPNSYATAPMTEPVKDGYAFCGYSLDGFNYVDLATTPITTDTTFKAIWGNKFAGVWTGSYVKEDVTYNIILKIFDSGLVFVTSNEYGFNNEMMEIRGVSVPNYLSYEGFMGSSKFCNITKLENNTIDCIRKSGDIIDFSCNLTKTTERLEQTYLLPFDKDYAIVTASDTIAYRNLHCTGYSILDSDSGHAIYSSYVIIKDKIYYFESGTMYYKSFIQDYELTDTYFKLGEKVYTFATS